MGARPTDLMASVQNQNFLKAQNSINGLPGASTGLGAIAGAIGHSPQMIDAQSMSDMSNDFLFQRLLNRFVSSPGYSLSIYADNRI